MPAQCCLIEIRSNSPSIRPALLRHEELMMAHKVDASWVVRIRRERSIDIEFKLLSLAMDSVRPRCIVIKQRMVSGDPDPARRTLRNARNQEGVGVAHRHLFKTRAVKPEQPILSANP